MSEHRIRRQDDCHRLGCVVGSRGPGPTADTQPSPDLRRENPSPAWVWWRSEVAGDELVPLMQPVSVQSAITYQMHRA
ncbi:hypothetical protein ADL06_19440 [Streptomyces sp. NRRL F-6491]|nr:hypothetical protein ADL06_19440 [Streptomyces sp. NRRL F-6491]KOX37063.1 hypothetical protein ADL08_30730 [Streptomyces sp. NRRL F-6492]